MNKSQTINVIIITITLVISANMSYSDDSACYLYGDNTLEVSIVDENSNPYWSSTLPIVINEIWTGGTIAKSMTVLIEGIRDRNLEITTWIDQDKTINISTGELVKDRLDCVDYPMPAPDQIFLDGFESGNLSMWREFR